MVRVDEVVRILLRSIRATLCSRFLKGAPNPLHDSLSNPISPEFQVILNLVSQAYPQAFVEVRMMTQLAGTSVRRGGVTSPYWYGTINYVSLSTGAELHIGFSMPSKGGGDTQVQVQVPPADFPTILEAMCIVDRQAALQAMSQELSRQISLQPERNLKTKAAGVASVVDRARERYWSTYSAEDRATMKAVEVIAA